MTDTNERIIVEFSGWIEVNDNTKFYNVETDETILASNWLALDETDRENYIVENVIDAQRDCIDGNYIDITISIEPLL
jgi:hypothetical protein